MPTKAIEIYEQDNTGTASTPNPGSRYVAPHNRVDRLTHVGFHKHLVGPGLPGLFSRWACNFQRRAQELRIGPDWQEESDIWRFWGLHLLAALNEALAGPLLVILNPQFNILFLEFLSSAPIMMRGLPQQFHLRICSVRDELVHAVKQWHAVARAKFKPTDVDTHDDTDPWWGSAFLRERQKYLLAIDNWDESAVAASDFGLFWG